MLLRFIRRRPALRAAARPVRRAVSSAFAAGRLARWLLARRGTIRRYIDAHAVRRLNIGAGFNAMPGWLNTDLEPSAPGVVYLDATKPFPFDDATFDFVVAEHVIEHVPHADGALMLRECLRVLRPGGVLRVATPSLEVLVALFAPEKTELQQRYIRWVVDKWTRGFHDYRECYVINNAFRNFGHQFIYDEPTLRTALADAGFANIQRCEVGTSPHQELIGVEQHGAIVGDEQMTAFETMVLEAVRPH